MFFSCLQSVSKRYFQYSLFVRLLCLPHESRRKATCGLNWIGLAAPSAPFRRFMSRSGCVPASVCVCKKESECMCTVSSSVSVCSNVQSTLRPVF